jgi:aldehyde:ferredoxin oxidoreductase
MGRKISGGYTGKILRIDLSHNDVKIENVADEVYKDYIGGAGLVTYFLFNELAKNIDPLGPDNKLVFATGPVTGVALPGGARHCIGAKSPLSNTLAKSEAGGFWGAELKFAGFDVLIVEGKADKPVYIYIEDNNVQIKSAVSLWGFPTKETQEQIREELGQKRAQIAMIGPGGENMVKYACVMHGGHDAAGRGGVGAVMGSKNLKAIAVKGSQKITVANPDGVKALRLWQDENKQLTAGLSNFGTNPIIPLHEKVGNLPANNFYEGQFPNVENITAQKIKETIRVDMKGCYACPVKCKKIVESERPYKIDRIYGGPEYETIGSLGSSCGVDDIFAIAKANELCNAYSLDTVSTGVTIACAMECYENGFLTKEDTGGLELKFGNAEAMLATIELIAKRQGVGDLLAEGSARASAKIGKGADKFAMHVKQQEIAMWEPRRNKGAALGYMTGPWGADHASILVDIMFSGFDETESVVVPDLVALGAESPKLEEIGEKKVELGRLFGFKRIIQDSVAICIMLPYSIPQFAEVTQAVTGLTITPQDLLKAAERTTTLARLYIAREGFTAADDVLPDRFFKPTRRGALSEIALDYDAMETAKQLYYQKMGWDKDGVPTKEKLNELGIIYE